MKAAVIVFPGSNCDRDLAVAFRKAGFSVDMVWHKDPTLPEGVDIVGIPGGFSFGDYLRCGAIAGQSPVMQAVAAHVNRGGYALGICNGFQVLCETGLLPGALMRNAGLKGCPKRRFRVTSKSGPVKVSNLLDQDFSADSVNERWASDITFIWAVQGWLYLVVVMVLYSQKIIGWSMSRQIERHIVIDAMKMALSHRRPTGDLIHHSDRGSQGGFN